MGWVEKTNMAVAKSAVGRRFRLEFSGHKFERKGSRFLTEIRAGLATFFAMAYIVSVNASIVASCGGTCVCTSTPDVCIQNPGPDYLQCQQEVRQDLVSATATIACLTSIAMGAFANLPISLAPGMGVNVYFAFQVVGVNGTGSVSYGMALTIVFTEGLIFVGMTILGLRQWLARVIPISLKIACGAGIGLYLSVIGLTYNAGIGAITGSNSEPLQLGGCVPELRDPTTGMCISGEMRNPTMWLGIIGGGFFTALLMMYRIRGALIFGILLVSIISWPRNTPFTYFPNTDEANQRFDFFRKIITFNPIKHILVAQDWNVDSESAGLFISTLLTFLYVDILDCTGTLYSMARFCGAVDENTQDFENSTIAYLTDAFGISIGSLFGLSPVTAFIESGAGISEGGATGLTAITTGMCFFVSIFFAPLFASIPPWATGCTLILVGAMMARAVVDINWRYMGDSVPAFLTLAIMPFTFSIAYGLIAGIVAYVILNGLAWFISKISGGRIVPHEYDQADYWSPRVREGILPGWLKRLAKGKRDFWREWNYDEEPVHLGSHDSYGQTVEWHPPKNSPPKSSTQDFVRSWEMPQISPKKSSDSASPVEYQPDRRRLEGVQEGE